MINRESVIEKIRKILSKTGSDANAPEAEVETALRFARKMMDEHNVSEAEVYASSDGKKSVYDSVKQTEVYERVSMDEWDVRLGIPTAKLCDVKMYTKQDRRLNKKGKRSVVDVMVYYGVPVDVAIAKDLYLELLTTMRTMLRFNYPKTWRDELKPYCLGFVDRLLERVEELLAASKATAEQTGCTAIVLCKQEIIESWAKDKLDLVSRRGRNMDGARASESYIKGHADGSKVSLGTNQIRGGGNVKAVAGRLQ